MLSKEQFDKIFNNCVESLVPNSNEEIMRKLKSFEISVGNPSDKQFAMFAYIESMNYARELVYSVLSETLVED